METREAIRTRRSRRRFTDEPVSEGDLDELIEAGRWAPSGLNNQPWRFMKVTGRSLIAKLSELTRYRGVVAGAAALIAVFLDGSEMYDRTKDVQSAGAAIQNILLAAHDMGLGACWMGEILANREKVERLLGVPGGFELMAIIALGHPAGEEAAGVRHPVEQLVIPPPEEGGR